MGVFSFKNDADNLGVLDLVPEQAAAAYSVRKLSKDYNGPAIRVRRSSDNAEQDIYFDGSGNLDISTLLTFTSAADALVTTWYDQSGNGKNQTQSTAASQPKIVDAGTLVTENGLPAIDFDGSDDFMNTSYIHDFNTQDFYEYGVFKFDLGSGAGYLKNISGASSIRYIAGPEANNNDRFNYPIRWELVISSSFLIADPTKYYLFTSFYNASAQTHSIGYNSSSFNTVNVSTSFTSSEDSTYLELGRLRNVGPAGYFNGKIQEFILFDSDQSANRTALESNINKHFKIY